MLNGSRLRPFKRLAGSWILKAERGGTHLELVVLFESRLPFLARLMSPFIRRVLERSLVRLEKLAYSPGGA
jgi:ribosome-associated toxin RatA of RatAB toxin-antitoxin module